MKSNYGKKINVYRIVDTFIPDSDFVALSFGIRGSRSEQSVVLTPAMARKVGLRLIAEAARAEVRR